MKKTICLLSLLLIGALSSVGVIAEEGKKDDASEKRANIDAMAKETIEHLFDQSSHAKKLYDKAHGYAVFSTVKAALGVSGGSGRGVAVSQGAGDRTYMKMGTAGVGFGLGGRKYRTVFLFETDTAFDKFVNRGWQADASASATAGTADAEAAATFRNGIAIFQIDATGLMAHAEVAGTKYWKSEKLN